MQRQLLNLARRGFRGYPLSSIAYFGPDNRRATKVTVAIVRAQGRLPGTEYWPREFWSVEHGDVRSDSRVEEAILDFLRSYDTRSVVITAGVVGCPHEEGVDDWQGNVCPHCPFWAGRNRWVRDRAWLNTAGLNPTGQDTVDRAIPLHALAPTPLGARQMLRGSSPAET
jgi:hypothetical protein